MGWLGKLPIVSLLLAGAMWIVPSGLVGKPDASSARFESARDEARAYLERNPQLVVDSIGELVLGSDWLAEIRPVLEEPRRSESVELPPRMLARSQGRLDRLIEEAYQARLMSAPAWRYGVLDARSPESNYFTHAFVHEAMAGILLSVAVLLLAGAALERTWGSLVFALFAFASIPITAYAYRLLDGSSGVPWSGAGGLAGALLGAYFIRGLGGHFVLPGWLLLPVWMGLEATVARGFSLDDLGSVPWASLMAAIAFGACVSGGLRLVGLESKLDSAAQSRRQRRPNPIVMRAARLRSDGDPNQAFGLIQAAWREDPRDAEVAEAFFSIAIEVGQPEAAAQAILPSLHDALKAGDVERALEYWRPLVHAQCDVPLQPTAAVRLGEALLDAGHPEEALFSLRGALDSGVSAAHATRIVNIARDLDEGLARRAAYIALADVTLDPRIRADLELIANPATGGTTREPGVSQGSASALVARGPGPLDAGSSDRQGRGAGPMESSAKERPASDPHEAALMQQDLDPSALSAETLGEDSEAPMATEYASPETSGDVLSHWNDPGVLENLNEDLGVDPSETPVLSADDLESLDGSLDLDALGEDDLLLDPREAETDSDMTPLLDATDELTSPLAAPSEGMDWAAGAEGTTSVFDQPTTLVGPAAPPSPMPSREPMVAPAAAEGAASSIAATPASAPGAPRRSLKALAAVPLAEGDEWIEVDVDERGKSRLPLARVDAIAIAAVSGLGPRPVLIVDFALNWDEDPAEPLKVIRLRSDRFDPHRFEPSAASPLEALTTWVARLQRSADARCLPSGGVLEGRFERFDALEAYERQVLNAVAGD